MKLKDISRTATFAWDQTSASAPLLATGAIAGALDESFSNDSQLEIWASELGEGQGFRLGGEGQKGPQGSITVSSRFNRLAWSAPVAKFAKGVIAAGMETGEVNVYDPAKILAGSSADDARIFRNEKHTGPVRGLDFNPIQKNLLLSGAINAELYITDLNNPSNPIPPGPLSTKLNEITSLQWNPTVSRVFAASSSSGYTSVWDLKAGKEIVSLQYGGGAAKGSGVMAGAAGLQMGKRRGMSDVCWHPESATRLITASEDDDSPIIMLWDLRNTRAPEKILSGHTKGVLSVAWCKQDSDLLLSCGKDNRTLCWNPQSGEIIGELPASNDWSFQTTWCPRNPDLLATASFDGHIGIHSLQTTQIPSEPTTTLGETATADDIFGALSQNEQPDDTAGNVLSLKQPPRWLRRPASATFGYGGLLASTNNIPGGSGKPQSVVHIRKIVTEPEIIDRAQKLNGAEGDKAKLAEFCTARAGEKGDTAWKALQTLFKADSRDDLVALLGFSKADVVKQVSEAIKKLPDSGEGKARDPLVTFIEPPKEDKSDDPAAPATDAATDATPSEISATSAETKRTEVTEFTETTSLFDELAAGAGTPGAAAADFFSSMAAGTLRNPQLSNIIPHKSEIAESAAATIGSRASSVRSESIKENTFQIYPAGESEIDRLITQALVLGDFSSAVDLCLASERFADALLLAVRGGPELLQSTQKAYFSRRTTSLPFLRVFQSIVMEDLTDIVQNADLAEWKVAFAVICSFAKESDFNHLADQLGQRLQYRYQVLANSDAPESKAASKQARQDSTLCYLAARRLEKVVSIWSDEMREEEENSNTTRYTAHALALQSFIEKVAVFNAATGYVDQDLLSPTQSTTTAEAGARVYRLASLYDRFYEYADLLATQGLVDIAARYVQMTPSDYKGSGSVNGLDKARDRLLSAAGLQSGSGQTSDVFGRGPAASAPAAAPRTTTGGYAPAPSLNSFQQPPAPYGLQPAVNIPPAPVPPTPSQYTPSQPSPYQPANQQAGYGFNSPYSSAQYQPQQSSQQPYGGGASGYGAPNGYAPNQQPSQGYSSQYGGQQQQYGGPPPAVSIPPPPRAGVNGAAATPPPLPAAQRRDMPGWNDAPSLSAPPKRPQSAAKEVKPAPIMSPFPMSSDPTPMGPPQGASPGGLGVGRGITPPPSRGAPGMLPPPPKGGPRPPSAQAVARQAQGQPPLPPQQVPTQASQQMAPPPSQQQQQQQYQQPPSQAQRPQQPPPPPQGPPRGATPRAGPPPPGIAGPPPPNRALSPLGPPGRTAQGNMQAPFRPLSAQNHSQSQSQSQGQGQAHGGHSPLAGPPPPGRAGPPPPGRTSSAAPPGGAPQGQSQGQGQGRGQYAPSGQQQQQQHPQPPQQQGQYQPQHPPQPQQQQQGPPQGMRSPPAPAAPTPPPPAPAKPTHPSGDRSHIPASSRPIYETLNGEMNRVKAANLPPHLKRIVDDTERRLGILFDQLNNESVPKDAVDRMHQISRAIAARDLNGALAMHVELLTGATGEMTAWVPGVKQLIRLGV